jgi:hypothetical protein
MAQQPRLSQGLLIIGDSSHSDIPHSVGLLSTSDQPDADLYPPTHNTHKRKTSMPRAGFEPTILVSKRPQTQAVDRAATGIATILITHAKLFLAYLRLGFESR